MNFAHLCEFFEAVRTAKGVAEKTKQAKSFLKKIRDEHHDLFSIVRLLVPKLDRDRPSYRIKESKVSKLLVKMLGLPHGNDKNLLLKAVMGTSVDFGDVIYSVLRKYIVNREIGMTVEEINTHLDKIANRQSDNGLDDQILDILRKLSPTNIKWLIQILLKDLKLGISDNNILNCFHEDGANFYATNNNLKKLCEVLSDPQVKLHELEINMFEAFRPMLSKRCDGSNFKKCFHDNKTYIVENKFDGERFQLHMEDGKFKFFSRNGYDFTNSYGSSYDEGSVTKLLKHVFDPDTNRIILDGEMMLWNTTTCRFGSKGMNLDVKKLGEKKYQPCFCVFDILLHNNKVLTNVPLHKRLQLLKHVIKYPKEGTIIVSDYIEAQTRGDIVAALNSSVDNNEEGIIVKDPKSVYKCSDRNSGWFKLKMEYFDDVVHDLDVLIMGGFYGSNYRINSLMVGISSGKDTFYSFGKISSGLSDDQLDHLNEKFKSDGVDFKDFFAKTQGKLYFGRETPHVYIEPHNSYVLTIRATELVRTTSDHVKCPYTLRFPRILSIRRDKPVDECLSMNELLELTRQNKSVIKLNKRHIELDEIIAKSKPAKKRKIEVINLEEPHQEGVFLKGKRFYVDSGTDKWGSEEIYHSIKKSGGDVSYRLEANVDIVLIGKMTPKISSIIKQSNSFDVIHVDWFQRVLEYREMVEYAQNEIFYCGANYRRDLSTGLDKFGDSFTGQASKESLLSTFNIMGQTDEFLNSNNAVEAGGDKQFFSQYVAYFDSFVEINNPGSKQIYYSFPDESEFEFYGGTINKELTLDVNLIIVGGDDRRSIVCEFLKNMKMSEIQIVTKDFIQATVSN